MKKILYGLADYDRFTGEVDYDIHLPMGDVVSGNIREFLKSAGENGWELCAAFPDATPGRNRSLPGGNSRKAEHESERIAMIFKKV